MVIKVIFDYINFVIVYVNDVFISLIGYFVEEVIGKISGLFQGLRIERGVKECLVDDLKNNWIFYGDMINYCKDGFSFVIEWKIVLVMDGDEVMYYVVVQRVVGQGL